MASHLVDKAPQRVLMALAAALLLLATAQALSLQGTVPNATLADDSGLPEGNASHALDAPSVTGDFDTDDASNTTKHEGEEEEEKEEEKLNHRPVIGILSQEPGRFMRRAVAMQNLTVTAYIAASYVKAVESAGARVLPIMINQPQEYYEWVTSSVNGILFPGGGISITNTSGYGRAGDALYQLVLAANANNVVMPLWATCLGFEMLAYLAADRVNPLSLCTAKGRADPLHMREGWQDSQLWRGALPSLMEQVQQKNLTSNFHKYCVTPEMFYNLTAMSDNYTLLSTSYDDDNEEYVSTIEHKQYPIFGVQWHPEKTSFEWMKKSIPHTAASIRLSHYVMEVFVEKARRNFNQFRTKEEEEESLIYNYNPVQVSKFYKSSFLQSYFF